MKRILFCLSLFGFLSLPMRVVLAQAISGPTIQPFQNTLSLPAGNSVYLYGMATGGLYAATPFAQGNYQDVIDADGNLSAALAMTTSNSNSFTTSAAYYVIGGVGVSGFTTMTSSYGANTQPGASSASNNFNVAQTSLVVFIGLASSQQSISLSGIPSLQVDAISSGPSAPIAMIVAHATLSPGTYTATEQSAALAAGQNPNNMADLLGVFVFGGIPAGMGNDPTTVSAYTSEPINTGNGNYFYQHADLLIPGRGIGVAFQRSYNSLDNYSGPLGTNWTHTYNTFAQITASEAIVKWGDGHGETYTLSGTSYTPPPGVFSTFVANNNGTFTLTQKNQTQYNFSSAGQLISIQDKNGNSITLTYNGNGNLAQITDTVGRNLSLSYDGNNRITQIIDPINRSVAFQYDSNNNLVQVTDPAGGVTQYAYDPNHRVTSIIQPNAQTLVQNSYDSLGRVISQTGGRGFTATLAYATPNPGQTTITDARGNNTVHTYDSLMRITSMSNALGGTLTFTYDANNDLTSSTNQNGKTTNFSYDSQGNVTGITDPLGNTSVFTFDAKNDLLTATNPKLATTTFTYDANGNAKSIVDGLGNTTTFSYDGYGELSAKTDARGNTSKFTYDAFGNLVGVADALSDITTLAYDGIGRLTSVTDPNGHTGTATYDPLSRLTQLVDPLGDTTKYGYDPVSNLLSITDANGNTTTYSYDAANNLALVTDALGHVTQYAYDANNNLIGLTNANSHSTVYAYDPLNRLVSVSNPLKYVTSYVYDPAGNVVATTDAKGQTNSFAYDALNRLLGISYADGKTVSYAYDGDGNRTTMVDSQGTTAYAYDALNRLTSVSHPGSEVVGYSYDGVGNRVTLTYPDGKVATYSYDAANRLSKVTDWLSHSTNYSYDAASNLTGLQYPNGASTSYAYDSANRLLNVVDSARGLPLLNIGYKLDGVGNRTTLSVDGVATTFAYNPLNELVSAQLGPAKSTWTYDEVGNRTQQVLPLLGSTNYTYDAADRLLTAGPAAYAYDADGNETSVQTSPHAKPTLFEYDAANRLTSASGSLKNSAFAYDGDSNRISQSVGTGTYTYVNDVATALPVVLQESGPDGSITYGYGRGMIEEFSSTFNYFYQYDGLGSVIALTDAYGNPQGAYAYDPWGNPLISLTNVGTKNKFRFTGQALDPGTGFYYLRARYYDPAVGRFLSADRFPGLAPSPLSVNKYAYVGNDATSLADPSGLQYVNIELWGGLGPGFLVDLELSPSGVLTEQVGIGVALGGGVSFTANTAAPSTSAYSIKGVAVAEVVSASGSLSWNQGQSPLTEGAETVSAQLGKGCSAGASVSISPSSQYSGGLQGGCDEQFGFGAGEFYIAPAGAPPVGSATIPAVSGNISVPAGAFAYGGITPSQLSISNPFATKSSASQGK